MGPNDILTLELVGIGGTGRGVVPRKVFGRAGGTIGRLASNDWVLPDPLVSGRHARIRHEQGAFVIEDTSTNGVFINSIENPLSRGIPHALVAGECILIDPYRISVSLGVDDRADPFMRSRVAAPFTPPPVGIPVTPLDPATPDELDPLNVLDLIPAPAKSPLRPVAGRQAADLAGQSPLAAHYDPPAVHRSEVAGPLDTGSVIPDGYDPLRAESAIVPTPIPLRRPRPSAPAMPPGHVAGRPEGRPLHTQEGRSLHTEGEALHDGPSVGALLEAIGLTDVPADANVVQTLASILQIAVGGVMDLLQARQRTKDEFRMHVTTFAPRENNPLKFSANVADALHNLLVRRNAAFLPPTDAFDDAFDDIRDHQVAMLAGVRSAFDSMLSEFDPDHLQQEFERASRSAALIPTPARLRYWELYRERVRQHTKDPDDGFRRLFGDEFARAYESKLAQLKADRRDVNERAMQ